MSKYIKNDVEAISNIDEHTLSTGIYDYLYDEWLEKFKMACRDLRLSELEKNRAAFYAGMRAVQQVLNIKVAEK